MCDKRSLNLFPMSPVCSVRPNFRQEIEAEFITYIEIRVSIKFEGCSWFEYKSIQNIMNMYYSRTRTRGGEWCFKNYGSWREIFTEIHGSRSLVQFLTVNFVRLAVSVLFTNLSRRIDFFKASKATKYQFVHILYINLNNVGTSQARINLKHFEVLVSQVKKSRCPSGSQRKTLVSLSRKVSHLAFTTPLKVTERCSLRKLLK